MRALEYGVVMLIVGALLVYGAHTLGSAMAASLNHSAQLVDDPGSAR